MKKITLVLLIMIISVATVGAASIKDTYTDTDFKDAITGKDKYAAEEADVPKITHEQIRKDMVKMNLVDFERKYGRKTLAISGKITEIIASDNKYTLVFGSGEPVIRCEFDKSAKKLIRELQKNQWVTVQGYDSLVQMLSPQAIIIERCKVVK